MEKTTPTTQELRLTMRHVAHAIAEQKREGLNLSDATIADLYSAARGEIDTDEVVPPVFHKRSYSPPRCWWRICSTK
jgi:hypothetical protein